MRHNPKVSAILKLLLGVALFSGTALLINSVRISIGLSPAQTISLILVCFILLTIAKQLESIGSKMDQIHETLKDICSKIKH